jgi:hypothetical protein
MFRTSDSHWVTMVGVSEAKKAEKRKIGDPKTALLTGTTT